MKAMQLNRMAPLRDNPCPLSFVEIPEPKPALGEVLLRVRACGVCHTELDEIEGRLPPARLPMVLGHEIVGEVIERGQGVTQHQIGDRVGVGWIHHSTGDDDENLSPEFRATGKDVDGGYAEFMTVPAAYAHPIPNGLSDIEAAPLLCAGAIGYRALRLTGIENGEPLGLMGFGGSGHLVLQLARHVYPDSPVFVFARSEATHQFARELGATWAGHTNDAPPEELQAIIDTTPAWMPVVAGLHCLRPGGRLVINAIRKEQDDQSSLLNLSYHEDLWMEKEIKSVANITARDIREFLQIAGEIPLQPTVETYSLEEANRALLELKEGTVRGAKVLVMSK
ncbi:MAG: zinc-dependent alcohol dehydrogenase family protein [Planctomycetaceae bacterium]|nr:zinc-dependent alcohol dehydrogenase family protein [Planctomycetaceae bacterium]